VRSAAGLTHLVELAELLQAAVYSNGEGATGDRMNFPSRHPLNCGRAVLPDADVVVALEVVDLFGQFNTFRDRTRPEIVPHPLKAGAKLVSIGIDEFGIKSNYQQFQRYAEVDLAIAGDGEATLPSLIEAVKRLITDDRRRAFEARGGKLAALTK